MTYHNTSSSAKGTKINTQAETAPEGYHYMPDGSLMSDARHDKLYATTRIINGISIDFSDIKEAGETRKFTVSGDDGAVFSLEVKNKNGLYYNFQTSTFQETRTRLTNEVIRQQQIGSSVPGRYKGNIKFPAVAAGDQYDFYLFSEINYNTKHITPNEVRFPDGSFDANSSSGSNANVVQKVIYQTLDVDIIIQGFSGADDITSYQNAAPNAVSQTITTSRGKNVAAIPFSITVYVAAGAFTIDRQPTTGDIMAFVTRTIGAAPVNIPGEDIYPAITAGQPNATSEGGTTVNGSSTGTTVTTHVVSNTIATVGDRVLGNAELALAIFRVTAVSGGSGKTFTISNSVSIADDLPLTFSNQRNYRWPIDNIDKLVEGMSVTGGGVFSSATTIKEYLVETTVFEGEKGEYKIDDIRVPSLDTLGIKPITTRDGTTKVATTTVGSSATPVNITFSNQALLSFADETVRIFGYGVDEVKRISGYDVEFSDLKAELNTVTTTTTNNVDASTTIPVTSKVGIVDKTTQTVNGAITDSKIVVLDSVTGLGIGQSLYIGTGLVGYPKIVAINETTKTITLSTTQTFADDITLTFPNSIISGPGISNTVVNPFVNTISSLNLTASVAQTLEDEQTFTFSGAGNIVTITGNIKVNKVGNEDVVLRFDIDKFLTQH